MRLSAWIWDFSSTHNTIALRGGSRYRPTTSRTLASNSGSVENLNVPAATASPGRRAMPGDGRVRDPEVLAQQPRGPVRDRQRLRRRLQGRREDPRIIDRLGPAAARRSARPSIPSAANRSRHLITVGRDTPTRPRRPRDAGAIGDR